MTWSLFLLFASPGFPLCLSALALIPGMRRHLPALLPLAPIPGLTSAVLIPSDISASLPRTFLGAGLMLDDFSRIFLGIAALLWCLAGVYAMRSIRDQGRERFCGFWLATLSGNLLLLVAADAVTFILSFAVLSFAAFGLVIHRGTENARRAARIYLILAVFGETCLLLSFMIAIGEAGSPLIESLRSTISTSQHRNLIISLMLAGFGLKAGVVPLHTWLPLAHPEAPAPASAVLSGAIVKAGIFGLARFLPLDTDLTGWGMVLVWLGLFTAYYAVVVGVPQTRPKTVLAYSTISQMGLLLAVLGSGLASHTPALVLGAIGLHAAHHSLAKGALFMSVENFGSADSSKNRAIYLATMFVALSIAGFPLTGGALAKLAIKEPVGGGVVGVLIAISAIGTTLLMFRFLKLVQRQTGHSTRRSTLFPFITCVIAAFLLPWFLVTEVPQLSIAYALNLENLWSGLWPIMVAAAVMMIMTYFSERLIVHIPEGDIIVLFERIWNRICDISLIINRLDKRDLFLSYSQASFGSFTGEKIDTLLSQWAISGTILLLIAAFMFSIIFF